MRTLRIACLSATFLAPLPLFADEGDGLLDKMSDLQYLAHKTALAIDAKNGPLADFYAHELEEAIEDAATVESYDGQPVGKLVNSMLVPAFEQVEKAVKAGKWDQASARFDDMVKTCNACHSTTKHGYVVIERTRDNPYMQSFAPTKGAPPSKPAK